MRIFFKVGSFVYIPSVGVNAYEVAEINKDEIVIVNNDEAQTVKLTPTRNVWVANEPNRVLLNKLFGEQFQKPLTTSQVMWDMFSEGAHLVPLVWRDDVEDDEFELSKSSWDYQLVSRYEFMQDSHGEETGEYDHLDEMAVSDYNDHWLVCNLETGLPVYKYA